MGGLKPSSAAGAALAILALMCAASCASANMWAGANSYYLHHYNTADRLQVLNAMQAAGFKSIRIFISPVRPDQKGSGNPQGYDIENPVGVWNNQQLDRINQLMLEASQRGMKLNIALHDRYALGCWEFDAYQAKYNIPRASPGCEGEGAKTNDLRNFYTNPQAAADMDRRFAYIVSYRNPLMGNRPWSAMPDAILGFDIQNEGQANQYTVPINANWVCDRARALKPRLAAGILVMTGGGADVADSVIPQHFACPAIDVVNVHSYNPSFASQLPSVISTARAAGKRIMVQEFGAVGGGKASSLQSQINSVQSLGLPWMVWQVNKPNNYNDFEVFVEDTASWGVLSNSARGLAGRQGAFTWPEVVGGAVVPTPSPSPPPPRPVVITPTPSPSPRPSPVIVNPSPRPSPPPPSPTGVSGPCAKCNISPCKGGCKCDASCNCRATWGLSPCDKCNIPQDQGGCKCDSNCNCLAGTCWM